MKHDVFISYRREGGFEVANLIASKLKLSGYRVFLDIHAMHSGDFSKQLEKKIADCKDFVWVLSPTSLIGADGSVTKVNTVTFREGTDYFRDEICWAIQYKKNIIPVILDGFNALTEYPQPIVNAVKIFNPSLDLRKLQAVEASRNQYFDASIDELKHYLHSLPIIKWGIVIIGMTLLFSTATMLAYFFQSGNTNNCSITFNDCQPNSLTFEGGSVDLIINDKSQGVKSVNSLDERIVYTDIEQSLFGKMAIVKFNALGYISLQDTLMLDKKIVLQICRDDTYAKYWGIITDYYTHLPLDSAQIIIEAHQTYSNNEGYFEILFPIMEQTSYKRMTIYKKGYYPFDDSEVYPGESRICLKVIK